MSLPLVLGASVFGWSVERPLAFAILDRFAAAGGAMVDTADSYSRGDSERILGEWLAANRGALSVATKVGMVPPGLAPARILAACDGSLARLGVDAIDLYYAHQDDPAVPQPDVVEAFGALVTAGKVRALAASNFTAPRLAAALDFTDEAGLPGFTAVQPRYNLLTRHDYEGPLAQLCAERGLAVHPYFALARGFLSGKYRTRADLAKSPRGLQMETLLAGRPQAILAAMDSVAAETGATLAQIALAWLVARPGVTAPVASVTSVAQLDELLAFRQLSLTRDQLDRLTAAGA